MLNKDEVLKQSKSAMSQWEEIWRKHAVRNNVIYRNSHSRLHHLLFRGTGKTVVVCALGHSFERNMSIIEKYRKKNREFETIVVDKCVKYINFKPDYVVIADAQVSYDYMKDFDSEGVTLISNICANPEWSENWKGKVIFYVNMDNIDTQKIFGAGGGLSDCAEMIPAASNVGNAAVVISSVVLGYYTILLSGFDYCFSDDYYAFHENHTEKHQNKKYWMNHRITISHAGAIAKTSENLLFSARWLADYIRTTPGNVFNTDKNTILQAPFLDLERQLQIAKHRKLSADELTIIGNKLKKKVLCRNIDEVNKTIKEKHVFDMTVSFLTEEDSQWLSLAS
jgi:hypothetical protein